MPTLATMTDGWFIKAKLLAQRWCEVRMSAEAVMALPWGGRAPARVRLAWPPQGPWGWRPGEAACSALVGCGRAEERGSAHTFNQVRHQNANNSFLEGERLRFLLLKELPLQVFGIPSLFPSSPYSQELSELRRQPSPPMRAFNLH